MSMPVVSLTKEKVQPKRKMSSGAAEFSRKLEKLQLSSDDDQSDASKKKKGLKKSRSPSRPTSGEDTPKKSPSRPTSDAEEISKKSRSRPTSDAEGTPRKSRSRPTSDAEESKKSRSRPTSGVLNYFQDGKPRDVAIFSSINGNTACEHRLIIKFAKSVSLEFEITWETSVFLKFICNSIGVSSLGL